jgi:DNA polymerase-3 subunit delta'
LNDLATASLPAWLQSSQQEIGELKSKQALSHALLLMGKDGGGQHVLASQLAFDLLCDQKHLTKACGECHSCRLNQSATHPDYHFLDGRDGVIKVDDIRKIIAKVATSPQVSHAKVVILAQASSMNINAANAVLKALEEPPAGTFFILTADATSQLIATVRSRCLLINLPEPSNEQSDTWLEQLELEDDVTAIRWVTQQPFTLFQLAKSGKSLLYKDIPNNLAQYLKGEMSADLVLSKLDAKNSADFLTAFSALFHQCICYSTGAQVPNQDQIQACMDALLGRLGIHKLMDCFARLQNLNDKTHKTNLNLQIQLKSELIYWLS